ncbi:hypothetical protein [Mycobacteroides abscessus]|uniref:hypothetical protein n=1 Tax=Mycobacteroides abscessus TaxID=36809 RepID=UPI0009A89BA3|nr:hypothetical protein [Mycobacteroides abscessus]SKF78765.1 Uncharacterised protein [Mycobacteroides abscessus subsp. bolletii]SKG54482.1 Uncharacterised protein [Mycobacteroides abscessus subsp. bolletii]SKG85508.1 Uncharacterised protein [Mycobacteroides abscessus subsp. bolletii]SKG92269.1 Uncharacterised protein [Mycobacteroides abscessus subsp. bolletii]SKH28245.1 Uncharacterised protein [Mycobacteroides abscessus subsp. bolletii]
MSTADSEVERNRKTLSAFVVRLRRIASHSLARDDNGDFLNELAQVTMTITIDKNTGGRATISQRLPDEELFESLASRLRPLTVPSDDPHYAKAFDALDALLLPKDHEVSQFIGPMRDEWCNATDRKRGLRTYSVITNTVQHTDVDLAFAWLYGDLVHGDHEHARLNRKYRFQAALSVFSAIAVLAIATLNLIRQLTESGNLVLPDGIFTDPI